MDSTRIPAPGSEDEKRTAAIKALHYVLIHGLPMAVGVNVGIWLGNAHAGFVAWGVLEFCKVLIDHAKGE